MGIKEKIFSYLRSRLSELSREGYDTTVLYPIRSYQNGFHRFGVVIRFSDEGSMDVTAPLDVADFAIKSEPQYFADMEKQLATI